MQHVLPPLALRFTSWQIAIEGHTRGLGSPSAITEGRGSRWVLRVSVAPMGIADALQTRAWLHSLRGRSGTTLLRMPGYIPTRPESYTQPYAESGTAVLNVAAAAGATTLQIVNASPAPMFVVGTLIHLGSVYAADGQMHRITSIAGSAVGVAPALRSARASGDLVLFGRIWSRWRLSGESPAVPIVQGRSLAFSLEFEEAW